MIVVDSENVELLLSIEPDPSEEATSALGDTIVWAAGTKAVKVLENVKADPAEFRKVVTKMVVAVEKARVGARTVVDP